MDGLKRQKILSNNTDLNHEEELEENSVHPFSETLNQVKDVDYNIETLQKYTAKRTIKRARNRGLKSRQIPIWAYR